MSKLPTSLFRHILEASIIKKISHRLQNIGKKNPEGLNPPADAEKKGLVGKQGCSSKMLHIVSSPEQSLQSIWGDF